jgi:hypothetical protein
LIRLLPRQLRRTSPHAVAERLGQGLFLGAAACLLLVVATLGLRRDLSAAVFEASFWLKWSYTVSMAAAALHLSGSLARPLPSRRPAWVIAVPLALLSVAALAELARTPRRDWMAMWLGGSWKDCPLLLLLLSVPVFVALAWSFRAFAPTRLRAAGAALGLAAGTSAGFLYCLHCPEVSALFVLCWYTLGFIGAAGLGALAGPRVLRW